MIKKYVPSSIYMKTSDRAEVPRYTTTFEYLLRYPLYIDRRCCVQEGGFSNDDGEAVSVRRYNTRYKLTAATRHTHHQKFHVPQAKSSTAT